MASPRSLVVRSLGAVAMAALLLAPSAAPRAQDDPVVARVNGVDIRQSDIAIAEELTRLPEQMSPDQRRESLVKVVAQILVVARAAEEQKFGDRYDVKRRLAFHHDLVLRDALLRDVGRSVQNDEAALHKAYDEYFRQQPPQQEVGLRHIAVETEPEAKAIVAELKKGADFAEEAKKKSKDRGAANGGDLGYFTKDELGPELSETVFKLDKGQISDPVRTQFGWLIFKIEDKRTRPQPSFDEVKGQLAAAMAQDKQEELIEKLMTAAKIELLDQTTAPSPMLNPAAPTKK